ncbi:MAG: hypothetical protein ACK5LY_02640 [Lachnospirales bacterium]
MNYCYRHINKEAIRKCSICGKDICEFCIEFDEGEISCKDCKEGKNINNEAIDNSEIKLVFDIGEKEDFSLEKNLKDIEKDFGGTLDFEDIKAVHSEISFNIEEEIEKRVKNISKNKANSNVKIDYKNELKREKENLKRDIYREKELMRREVEREKERIRREVEREKERLRRELNKNIDKEGSFMKDDSNKYEDRNIKKSYSSFLLFCFSLIPGAGHMYLEMMNRGLFFCIVFFGSALFLGNPIFPIVIFMYSFFDLHKHKNMILRGDFVEDTLTDIFDFLKNPIVICCIILFIILGPIVNFVGEYLPIIAVICFVIFLIKRGGRK